MRLPFGNKHQFVLKARKGNTWEDIATFDKPVSLLEVKDVIEDYLADGYDAFRLEEKDAEGKKVRLRWTKYYKLAKLERGEDIEEKLDKVIRFMDAIEKVYQKIEERASSKSDRPTAVDLMAEIMYYEEMKKQLRNTLGGGEGDPLANLLMGILTRSFGAPMPYPANMNPASFPATPALQTPLAAPPAAQNPQLPTPNVGSQNITPPPKPPGVEEKAQEIHEGIKQKIKPQVAEIIKRANQAYVERVARCPNCK